MIARWVRAAALAGVLLGCHRVTLQAQRPPHELRAWAGLGCFVDESWCDVPHAVVGFGPNLYFSRSWSFAPEFLYARSSWDYDLILLPSLAVNLRSQRAVRPYAIFGFGLLRHHAGNVSATGWSLQGGLGVKIFVNPRVYVAPEIRLGWEPFLRVGASGGVCVRTMSRQPPRAVPVYVASVFKESNATGRPTVSKVAGNAVPGAAAR